MEMLYNTKENCSGCGACANICPKDCISMKEDEEGFLYPSIDIDECVNCKACIRVCPFKLDVERNNILECYGCYSLSNESWQKSSSGAVFSLFATQVISNGGIVFGTAMSSDCKSAQVVTASTEVELERLYGSKYLQSNARNSYSKVKFELLEGYKVLFTGTPCQVNALKSYLDKEYDNLICVEIICHGVPSPKLWKKYVEALEQRYQSKIQSVNFRCKDISWREFGIKERLENREVFFSKNDDSFMQMFLKNYCLRPSCYSCKAKKNKLADITIGDFWGVEHVLPDLNDEKGVSLVIVRTEKGEKLFDSIKENTVCQTCLYEKAIQRNSAELRSVSIPQQRNTFFRDLNMMSYDKVVRRYLEHPLKRKIKRIVKSLITRLGIKEY